MEGLIDSLSHLTPEAMPVAATMRSPYALLHCVHLGIQVVPHVHVILPTHMGAPLDPHRRIELNLVLSEVCESASERCVVQKLDAVFRMCALCGAKLRVLLTSAPARPYQVALHLMGGQLDDEGDRQWYMSSAAGLLCRSCQTHPCEQLVVAQCPDWFVPLRKLVHRALEKGPEFVLADDVSIDDAIEDLALQFAHCARQLCGALNWRRVLRWRRDDTCDHCNSVMPGATSACLECGVLEYCEFCAPLVPIYHHQHTVCPLLRDGPLLDDEDEMPGVPYVALHTKRLDIRVADSALIQEKADI